MKNRTIHLGVTGHRTLPHPTAARASIQQIITQIETSCHAEQPSNIALVIISPLAEGADRIVAEEVLKRPDSRLIVPLPLEVEDYLTDFQTQQSKEEFFNLLAKAQVVTKLPPQPTRAQAYEAVGRYVVDHSDILIALWDGLDAKGKGGTAEIVAYARNMKNSLYWVHTEKEDWIREERTNRQQGVK